MNIVLGIDNGTQSTKVLFYDADSKNVVAFESEKHSLITGENGLREQKAEWWMQALRFCLSRVSSELKSSVRAVGVSGQQHGFVSVDEEGRPLHNVKLWCDTSTSVECNEITESFGGAEKLFKETGNRIAPGYTASKILWFRKHHPDKYERMRWVMLPHDYLNFSLTGISSMEYGDGSGTGLMNIRERVWHEDLVKTVDRRLMEKLPPLIEPDVPVGTLSAEAASWSGLPEGIPVSSGGGDNMMGAIGTGTIRDGVVTMSLGTSGTLYGFSDKPVVDPDGILAAFCSSSGGWLPLLCTMNCTVATELTRELFGMSVGEIDSAGAAAEAGADGVVLIPFFNGERVPALPKGRASIMGLNAGNYTRENIARASLESAVYGMKIGLEKFKELGFNTKEIRMIGGGAQSPLWRQMTADVLGVPILIPNQIEAAALGAALQAWWVLRGGGADELAKIVDRHVSVSPEKSCTPNQKMHRVYKEGYSRYQEWLDILSPGYR